MIRSRPLPALGLRAAAALLLTLGACADAGSPAAPGGGPAPGGDDGLDLPPVSHGTVSLEGRTYPTITIDGQTWLAANYVFTEVPDYLGGDPLPYMLDPALMKHGTFDVGESASCAVNPNLPGCDRIPAGWRVATPDDWEVLFAAVTPDVLLDPHPRRNLAITRLAVEGAWPFETSDVIGFGLLPTGSAWFDRWQAVDQPAPASEAHVWHPRGSDAFFRHTGTANGDWSEVSFSDWGRGATLGAIGFLNSSHLEILQIRIDGAMQPSLVYGVASQGYMSAGFSIQMGMIRLVKE